MESASHFVKIEFIDCDKYNLGIEADFYTDEAGKQDVVLRAGNNTYECKYSESSRPHLRFTVPVEELLLNGQIEFIDRKSNDILTVQFGKFSRIPGSKYSYRAFESLLLRPTASGIRITNDTRIKRFAYEVRYLLELLLLRKKALFYRIGYWIVKPFYIGKELWLLSDRPYSVGDNAEYLFRYISAQNDIDLSIVPIFTLNKNLPQYKELKKIGRVIPFGSYRYRVLSLLASKRISSHFDEYIINPLGGGESSSDLWGAQYIYLEHGVLTSDSSEFFGKLIRNAKLVTTASSYEKEAIITTPSYGYTNAEVRVTGHARFDGLTSNAKRKIVLMPTWRQSIAGSSKSRGISRVKKPRQYSDDFKGTDYYKFYNELLNSDGLHDLLERHDYTVELYLHPSLGEQWIDFTPRKRVVINKPPHDYSRALSEGSIMITDYSGVAFDFAYMDKPVIYAQFDKDDLYKKHYYKKGKFSFESEGFGPVVYTQKALLEAIEKCLENGAEMEDVYRKRTDHFFDYRDKNNSRRIYREIVKI